MVCGSMRRYCKVLMPVIIVGGEQLQRCQVVNILYSTSTLHVVFSQSLELSVIHIVYSAQQRDRRRWKYRTRGIIHVISRE